MKVIKKFWAPIFIVCFLLLGYVIGQVRNSVKAGQELVTEESYVREDGLESNTNSEPAEEDVNLSDVDNDDEWHGFRLAFENSDETTDNPWGFTAGLIDVDEDKCVFLTPNTGVMIYPNETGSVSVFDAYIHPWVADASDGAGLVVWYLDKNDGIVGQEEVNVGTDGENAKLALDLTRYHEADHFKILCNNGGSDDSSDWVVVKAK